MKIRLLLAGAMLVGLGAGSQAQLLLPSQSERRMRQALTEVQLQQLNIAMAQSNRVEVALRQLTVWTRKHARLLDQPKPNVLQMRQAEHQIRRLRVQLTRETSHQLTLAEILKRMIVQKQQQRRALQRQPKTPVIRERIDNLSAQLQAARAIQKGTTMRPTPTPRIQLLSF